MSSAAPTIPVSEQAVLTKAAVRAGKALGLTQAEVGQVIGRDRTSLRRGIDPESKSGELAAMLIRIHRSLYALVGGDPDVMLHWMATENLHTGGVPREQVCTVAGLTRVTEYLDAIRGKV